MFGGEGKDNSLKALWDSIRGDASTYQGSSDSNIDNELAGFDLKYSFILKDIAWSFYGQYIGEDGTDYWPWRTFYLAGTEFIYLKDGKTNSLVIEYINTYYFGAAKGVYMANFTYEHSPYLSGYRFKGSPIGAFIDGDSNYAHLSYNGEINNFTNIEFSIFYGNFNKDKDGIRNSWGTQNDDFFGIALNFDFKINSKIDAGINITSLSEELLYREKFIDKTIIGLDFKYRF
jgi:hypothetical protein